MMHHVRVHDLRTKRLVNFSSSSYEAYKMRPDFDVSRRAGEKVYDYGSVDRNKLVFER